LLGWANNRHVDTEYALQHNLGLGGAVVVNVYKRADGKPNRKMKDQEITKKSYWNYNPATEARYITKADADKVRSKENRVDFALGDTEEKLYARL